MSDILWSDVTDYAPELLGKVSIGAQTMILAVVNEIIPAASWGGDDSSIYKFARILWAAHVGTIELRKGQPGSVTSQSMGGISQSYGAGPTSTSYLSLTSYGQTYLMLAKTRAFRAGFTTGMVRGTRGPIG